MSGLDPARRKGLGTVLHWYGNVVGVCVAFARLIARCSLQSLQLESHGFAVGGLCVAGARLCEFHFAQLSFGMEISSGYAK